jgi:Zn-dependent protease with chaperone function
LVIARVDGYGASERAHLLLTWAIAPWLLAWCAVLLAFLPTVLVAEAGLQDWCMTRNGADRYACPMHGSDLPVNALTLFLVAALLTLGAVYAWRFVRAMYKAVQLARGVSRSCVQSTVVAGYSVDVLPGARPLALSLSVPRPRILVSERVLQALPAAELRALLAHEQAHLDRRDGLMRLLLTIASSVLFPQARQALRAAWNLASEQACDARAAGVTDACTTAGALLRYARLMDDQPAPAALLGCAFADGDVKARVLALIQPRVSSRAPRLSLRWLMLAAAPLALVLHELGEFLLLPLVR